VEGAGPGLIQQSGQDLAEMLIIHMLGAENSGCVAHIKTAASRSAPFRK